MDDQSNIEISPENPTDDTAVPEICAHDLGAHELIRRPHEAAEKGLTPEEINRAIDQEEAMAEAGRAKFEAWCHAQVELGEADVTPGGREMARRFLGPIYESIDRFQRGEAGLLDPLTEKAVRARRGPQPGSSHRGLIEGVDPMLVAGVTFKVLLSQALVGGTYNFAVHVLSQELESAVMFTRLQQHSRKLARNVAQRGASRNEPTWKQDRRIADTLKRVGQPFEPWGRKEAGTLAATLLRLVTDRTGAVVLGKQWTTNKSHTVLELTEEAEALVETANGRAALLQAELDPFVVPPRDWRTPCDGVFWSDNVRHLNLIGRDGSRERLDALWQAHRDGSLAPVMEAINAIQATPYRVNRRVWEAMVHMAETGQEAGGFPVSEPVEREVRRPDQGASEETWKAYRIEVAKAKGEKRQALAHYIPWRRTADLAERFVGEDAIWFGWRCDFRGRMYPMQTGLSPQGPEYEKALLEFARPVPIEDEQAAFWLAVHGANAWAEDVEINGRAGALDKLRFEDRVAWIEANTGKITACAADPVGTTWWREADEPWLFLAFCFEWAEFQREGYGYLSRLPCAIDGTCNGLQHLSAMARDPVGAEAVNLCPAEQPNDIYKDVAERTKERLRDNVQAGGELARGAGDMLELGVDRKVTKRTVMTVPYGISQHGSNAYVREALEEEAKKAGKQAPWRTRGGDLDHDRLRETLHQTEVAVWRAVHDSIGPAMGVMSWIQECSNAVVREGGVNLRWTAPSGFPVVQTYRKKRTTRLDIKANGRSERVRVDIKLETPEISPKDHKTGSAPNVVHSFDAAHMVATVRACLKEGIRDFAMVHDSFGCHAAHVEALHQHTRETFAAMYDFPVLHTLGQEWERLVEVEGRPGVEIPEPPVLGSYQPVRVRLASYFFG